MRVAPPGRSWGGVGRWRAHREGNLCVGGRRILGRLHFRMARRKRKRNTPVPRCKVKNNGGKPGITWDMTKLKNPTKKKVSSSLPENAPFSSAQLCPPVLCDHNLGHSPSERRRAKQRRRYQPLSSTLVSGAAGTPRPASCCVQLFKLPGLPARSLPYVAC